MDDALLVCGFERLADVLRNLESFVDRNRSALQPIGDCLSIDKFKDEKLRSIGFFEIVDRGNIRMIQRRENLSFALESAETVRVARELIRQDLDRDLAFELRVPRGTPRPCRLFPKARRFRGSRVVCRS